LSIEQFLEEYFVKPLAQPGVTRPFNSVNTLVYAAIALVAAYLVYRSLKKAGVKIDERLFYAVLPFVLLGSSIRVLVDAGILPRAVVIQDTTLYLFVTPGVYITTFAITVACLWVSLALQKRNLAYDRIMRALGALLAASALLFLLPLMKFFLQAAGIIILASVGLLAFLELRRIEKRGSKAMEKIAVFSQSLDGAATFIGITLGSSAVSYTEQHVFSSFLAGSGGPFIGLLGFFLVKVAFAILVAELASREFKEEKQVATFILLLITIFGAAPGLRDLLRIVAGV
jgi:uncharacterized membrane protein